MFQPIQKNWISLRNQATQSELPKAVLHTTFSLAPGKKLAKSTH